MSLSSVVQKLGWGTYYLRPRCIKNINEIKYCNETLDLNIKKPLISTITSSLSMIYK
jgi:hypothetical protein